MVVMYMSKQNWLYRNVLKLFLFEIFKMSAIIAPNTIYSAEEGKYTQSQCDNTECPEV
jgi:hypothetical protein